MQHISLVNSQVSLSIEGSKYPVTIPIPLTRVFLNWVSLHCGTIGYFTKYVKLVF